MYNIEKYNGIDIEAVLWINTVWTCSRSGRDGAVLGSKRPRQGLPSLYGPAQYFIQRTAMAKANDMCE